MRVAIAHISNTWTYNVVHILRITFEFGTARKKLDRNTAANVDHMQQGIRFIKLGGGALISKESANFTFICFPAGTKEIFNHPSGGCKKMLAPHQGHRI
jgi:hypothetical protein